MILWNYILASNYPGAARVILLVSLEAADTDKEISDESKMDSGNWWLHFDSHHKQHQVIQSCTQFLFPKRTENFPSFLLTIILSQWKMFSRRWFIFLFPSHSFCSAAGIPKEQQNQNEIWFWIKNLFRCRSFFYSKFKVRKGKANLEINFDLVYFFLYLFFLEL